MSAKGELINRLRHLGLDAPHFDVQQDGPAHDPHFRADIRVGSQILASGEGRTKRDAERVASEAALDVLDADERVAAPLLPDDEPEESLDELDAPADAVWPIYADVLASALQVAHKRTGKNASLDDVRDAAARLYADLLTDLGHGPERR
ncbi:putative dsRNA-binding protein [Deinococcus maricopensis]|uniref:Double-stranded RNA binding domain protein n=1 Tax=Deinococcus maricopensis (strain DSM 21211 / LMG 22137 / NRRL B-23946 / LB-34) TaxID=709986 RepID=E8U5R2_DEIML|nr:putative dsRNA-binding protein [Deinococcus maricopensis]ADV66401.1 double-stranded RNA binding domain protein [Deinococcus maricopensis DSM 21211]